ncbi:MAG: pseudouridine synthase [Chitinivibrionales bacterium]
MENKNNISNPDDLIRLNRFCARCGLGSRRSCDTLIASGKISVNGKRVTELGTKIDPVKDKIEYEGKILKPGSQYQYLAYHKTRGVMVTKSDPEGRATIYEALRIAGYDADGLNYVGRLDFNSEGLILLTNDGDLIHALTHPRYRIKKVYEVRTNKKLSAGDAQKMIDEGITSEDQVLHAGDIHEINTDIHGEHWYEIVLYEGKQRQVRRMFEALGYQVIRLKRNQFASVKLGLLPLGAYRPLSEKEISALLSAGWQ